MLSPLRLVLAAASWLGLLFVVTASPLGKRQGVNEVYPGNEAQQTAALNTTYYFVPIAADEAQSLAGGRALLKPKGLPQGYLKDDEHVLFVQDGYTTDIRMLDLRVDHIRNLLVQVPFVDELRDGKTPFNVDVGTFQDSVLPALVADIVQQQTVYYATFNTDDAPFVVAGPSFVSSAFLGLDNTIPVLGGPGVLHPVFQSTFHKQSGKIPRKTFETVTNTPYIRTLTGACSTQKVIFDNDQASPFPVKATSMQLGTPAVKDTLVFKGRDIEGLSLSVQWIAPAGPGEPCTNFAPK